MPCYEIRTVNVEFKIENIEILQKALKSLQLHPVWEGKEQKIFLINEDAIDLKDGQYISRSGNIESATSMANQVKRAYSIQVLDELAKKQKWMKKQLGENKFQFQRF